MRNIIHVTVGAAHFAGKAKSAFDIYLDCSVLLGFPMSDNQQSLCCRWYNNLNIERKYLYQMLKLFLIGDTLILWPNYLSMNLADKE